MQNLSSSARWAAAAAELELCAGEFCGGEFCADSVTAEQKTALASAMLIDAGDRVKELPFNGYGSYVAKTYSTG